MFGKAILKVIINPIIKFVLIYTNVHKMKKIFYELHNQLYNIC